MDKKIVKLIENTRIGYLATASSNMQPYVIPVVFVQQNENVYVPLDQKPKSVNILELKRVKNIEENSKVCFLVHHYDEDWTKTVVCNDNWPCNFGECNIRNIKGKIEDDS